MNVLVAIDHSEASRKAARFVADMFQGRSANDVSVTLVHVVESLPDYVFWHASQSDSGDDIRRVADDLAAKNRTRGEELLNEQKQALVEAGLPADSVGVKLLSKEALPEAEKVVAALAIIEEMKAGPYSIVCLGRRGSSLASGSFVGSVAQKVLREAYGRTVWVVD